GASCGNGGSEWRLMWCAGCGGGSEEGVVGVEWWRRRGDGDGGDDDDEMGMVVCGCGWR
nr:hypothetical protein [Tanacetum cinerariifolium]GEZ64137.1 hypothetical protein [Tanacetum cinerariifolium]